MPRARQRQNLDVSGLPTRERRSHGAIERLEQPIEDSLGEWSKPLRAIDTLTAMLRERSIGIPEKKAGDRFHDLFRLAHLDGLFASDTSRLGVILAGANGWRHTVDGDEAARLAVMSALDALGGIQQPGGSCAWYVLGLEWALGKWATSTRWVGGRRISRHQASGVLITDLGILKGYFDT